MYRITNISNHAIGLYKDGEQINLSVGEYIIVEVLDKQIINLMDPYKNMIKMEVL